MYKNSENAVLIVTHSLKMLQNIRPDYVHILIDGKIVDTGDAKLADEIEKFGYANYKISDTSAKLQNVEGEKND